MLNVADARGKRIAEDLEQPAARERSAMSAFAGANPLLRSQDAETTESEFTAFVLRHSRFAYQVAYAIVRHAQDAEDIVQDTFLKLHRNASWQRAENERAFLGRVTWRLALDARRLRSQRVTEETASGTLPDWTSPAPSPERHAIDIETHAAVHRLIDALPEELRQPLVLSSLQELTSAEVGEIMDIPEGTVRTRVMRARQLLRDKLQAGNEVRHGR